LLTFDEARRLALSCAKLSELWGERREDLIMPLRVLSGVIRNEDGPVADQVVIGFNPHVVISAPQRVEVVDMRTIGPDGRFLDVPAEHVAPRELDFRISGFILTSARTRFFIGTTTTLDQITITWSKGSRTLGIYPEISYMIIGEIEGSGSGSGGGQSPVGTPTPGTPGGIVGQPVTPPSGTTTRGRRRK
jgi:hypothetical protein